MKSSARTAASPLHRLSLWAIAGVLALGATVATSIAVQAQDAIIDISTVTDELGTYLVDEAGLTLYYFGLDGPGAPTCDGECLTTWPLLLVGDGQFPFGDDSVTGTLSFAVRDDGARQATYRGRPLYYFAADEAAGDTLGNSIAFVWWVAAEDGSLVDAVPLEESEVAKEPELTLQASTTELGTFITGADGRTAYYLTIDSSPGVSLCSGGCLDAWSPVTLSEAAEVAAGEGLPGVVGVISAADGSPQVTYDGRPLYYFDGDLAAGDTNGQGLNGQWFVASADGQIRNE
ncbi:MAG: hypothetical protein ACC726_03215 [Chloroflexota bacterium]